MILINIFSLFSDDGWRFLKQLRRRSGPFRHGSATHKPSQLSAVCERKRDAQPQHCGHVGHVGGASCSYQLAQCQCSLSCQEYESPIQQTRKLHNCQPIVDFSNWLIHWNVVQDDWTQRWNWLQDGKEWNRRKQKESISSSSSCSDSHRHSSSIRMKSASLKDTLTRYNYYNASYIRRVPNRTFAVELCKFFVPHTGMQSTKYDY